MLGKKSARYSARRSAPASHQNQQIFSYRAARKETDRQFDRGSSIPGKDLTRFKRKLKHLPFVVSLIAIVIALLYNLTLTPNAQIIISGNQAVLRPKQSYQEAINKHLASSLMNRTKVTINTNRLSEDIRRQFPEIQTLAISLPLLRHQPVIDVRLALPAALLATPNITYVLDTNGRALFDKNDARTDFDTSKLPVITDPSGHVVTLGTVALASQQIVYANEIMSQAAAKQLRLDSMTLQAGGEELHLRFKDIPYLIKFSFGAEARQSFGAFLVTRERLEQLERDKGTPEYIDVRIPERSYVK